MAQGDFLFGNRMEPSWLPERCFLSCWELLNLAVEGTGTSEDWERGFWMVILLAGPACWVAMEIVIRCSKCSIRVKKCVCERFRAVFLAQARKAMRTGTETSVLEQRLEFWVLLELRTVMLNKQRPNRCRQGKPCNCFQGHLLAGEAVGGIGKPPRSTERSAGTARWGAQKSSTGFTAGSSKGYPLRAPGRPLGSG